ncbi:MAG: portal protein [Candidatus Heimdallarchaeaceae archaeon]|jgi:hypothetical protein
MAGIATEAEAQMQLELVDQGISNVDDPDAMDDAGLVAIIDGEMQHSYGDDDSELSSDRGKALDYYFNRPRGDEVAGRSKVQTSDVMDVIEWLKPDIIEAFTTNEDAVKFLPYGEKDVDQARLESRYINHIFYTEAGGYLTLHDIITDALLSKNGIVKTIREERIKTKYMEYTGLNSVELDRVLQDSEETKIEVYEQDSRQLPLNDFPPEAHTELMGLPDVQEQIRDIQLQVQQSVRQELSRLGYNSPQDVPFNIVQELQQQSGQIFQEAMSQITVTLYDIKIKIHMIQRKSRCIPVPPENFRVNEDHPSICLDDARFTSHIEDMTESDLIELGIDPEVVADLPPANKIVNEETFQRQFHNTDPIRGSYLDKTTRNIEVEDCWLKVDYDGDGVAELRHVMKVGSTIILNEYADENPFSSISPIMVTHRWVGVSMADRIKQIQDIGTAVWRQLLDNFYRANNNRTVIVENQVNMDDLLTPRAAGFVRARNTDAVKPFPYTPIGAEAYQLLEKLGRNRMERSGVGPEMMAEGMVIDNDTAHGVERLMAAKEKLVGMIIRNFAETGIADIFKKLHSLEVKHQHQPREFDLNGQWITVEPSKWHWRNATLVKVGLGAGDKMRHAGTMGKVLANQKLLVETGKTGVLISDEKIYTALCDEIRYEGIRNPEQYYIDPRTPEAVQTAKKIAAVAAKPKLEDKILMLESQIEQKDAQLRDMKQFQDHMIKKDEQMRKWVKDADESKRDWERVEIEQEEAEDNGTE